MNNTPPIGGFQEVDGHQLFVHRAGSGGPAVVFLPGAGAVGLDYFVVQQGVSQFTTAVVYDRGGTGHSDRRPLPRSAATVATELRKLLQAMDIDGPYVLAAHSLGGFYAHRFAQLFPREVAGLVWLDALHRDWDEFMPDQHLAVMERTAPSLDQLERMRPSLIETYTELRTGYPDDVGQALIEAKVSTDWLRVGIAERTNLVALARELQTGPSIPDVPVVALTIPDHEGKAKMDAALVGSVSRGEQRILADTHHHRLCFDRPDAVIQAVRDVVGPA
jgi:pimeloyl-ACP methyl ester carboxylesterase